MLGEGVIGAAAKDDLIRTGSDATFMADVIEESKKRPVIVDFWAPWCGPCRQLTPVIEKAVAAAAGAVRLVKINIDENPRVAGQLRVQSIPAVFAFSGGQPVDGFMGALPESQVRAFIDRLMGADDPGGEEVGSLLEIGAESLAAGDLGGAGQAFAQVLQLDPANVAAIAGMARVYLSGGDVERAREIAALAPADDKSAEIAGVRAALALAEQGAAETAEFDGRLARNADDHEARFELSKVLAGRGDFQGAADHLLTIVEKDRAWNDDAARKQLLTVFDAAGPTSEVAKAGRRRLSSILFS